MTITVEGVEAVPVVLAVPTSSSTEWIAVVCNEIVLDKSLSPARFWALARIL